ncbi:Uncharacterized protein Adt_23257 [Abeliophyllum distichum]|uniref:Uncharacterized protein n=1 Tax=Abeliophyllum distichum TaxID=126358 RepID=A0ABD1SDC2_9LAMI
MNALRKAAKCEDSPPAVMTIRTESMDIDPEKVKEEMILDEELDLRIIGSNSLAFPTEELEAFSINPSDPTQMLQVVHKLEEGLKQFLQENTDVFAWKQATWWGKIRQWLAMP